MPPDGFVHALQENPGKVIMDSILGIMCIVGFWLLLSAVVVFFWPAPAFEMGMWGIILLVIGYAGIFTREKLK